jgi:transketolase
VETAEAWEVARSATRTATVLCLSRQNLPTVRTVDSDANLTARGAYVLRETEGPRGVTIVATGSEVALALEAAEILATQRIAAAVVSAPSFELFAAQDPDYRESVLGSAPMIGVEAAVRQGWQAMIGCDGAFVGMSGFGASAPAEDLYTHFGITAQAVADAAMRLAWR